MLRVIDHDYHPRPRRLQDMADFLGDPRQDGVINPLQQPRLHGSLAAARIPWWNGCGGEDRYTHRRRHRPVIANLGDAGWQGEN